MPGKRKSILEKNVRGKGSNADFQRTTLRVGKKPRAASNATSTAFSVRRVVVREQSVGIDHKGAEVTFRGHDVAELLRRMNHSKHKERTEALQGMKELLKKHPRVLELHAVAIVNGLLGRVADPEAETRRQLHGTLHTLLTLLESHRRVEPFLRKFIVSLCRDLGQLDHKKRRAALIVIDMLLQCCASVASRLRAFDPAYVGGSAESQLLQSLRSLVDTSGLARGSVVSGGILEKFRSEEKAKAKGNKKERKKKANGGVKYDEVRLAAVATLHRILQAAGRTRAAPSVIVDGGNRGSSTSVVVVANGLSPISIASSLTRPSVADAFTGWAPIGSSAKAVTRGVGAGALQSVGGGDSVSKNSSAAVAAVISAGSVGAQSAGGGEPQTTLALIQGLFDVWLEVAPTATRASAAAAAAQVIKMAMSNGGAGRRASNGGSGGGGGGRKPSSKQLKARAKGKRTGKGGKGRKRVAASGGAAGALPPHLLHMRLVIETLRHLVVRVQHMPAAARVQKTAAEIGRRRAWSGAKQRVLTVAMLSDDIVRTLLGNFQLMQSASWDEIELELEVYDCIAFSCIALAGRGKHSDGATKIPMVLVERFFTRIQDERVLVHTAALLRVAHKLLPHVPLAEQDAIIDAVVLMWKKSKSRSDARRLCVIALHRWLVAKNTDTDATANRCAEVLLQRWLTSFPRELWFLKASDLDTSARLLDLMAYAARHNIAPPPAESVSSSSAGGAASATAGVGEWSEVVRNMVPFLYTQRNSKDDAAAPPTDLLGPFLRLSNGAQHTFASLLSSWGTLPPFMFRAIAVCSHSPLLEPSAVEALYAAVRNGARTSWQRRRRSAAQVGASSSVDEELGVYVSFLLNASVPTVATAAHKTLWLAAQQRDLDGEAESEWFAARERSRNAVARSVALSLRHLMLHFDAETRRKTKDESSSSSSSSSDGGGAVSSTILQSTDDLLRIVSPALTARAQALANLTEPRHSDQRVVALSLLQITLACAEASEEHSSAALVVLPAEFTQWLTPLCAQLLLPTRRAQWTSNGEEAMLTLHAASEQREVESLVVQLATRFAGVLTATLGEIVAAAVEADAGAVRVGECLLAAIALFVAPLAAQNAEVRAEAMRSVEGLLGAVEKMPTSVRTTSGVARLAASLRTEASLVMMD